jgi:hypothetical protein
VALFAGAALYITVIEHPPRMSLDTQVAMAEWAPSYKRATWMQAPLAVIGFAAGAGAWGLGAPVEWLIASLLIGSVVPFTFLAIMPTNNRLLAHGRDAASAETRSLLERWGKLHAVRTMLSLAAFLLVLGFSV